MSLFGSPPDHSTLPASSAQNSSLFDDEQRPTTRPGNSLFDDEAADGSSPWGIPTPKKADKSDLVKTLISTSETPESYIDAFDTLVKSGYKEASGRLNSKAIGEIFDGSGVERPEQDRIVKLVTGGREAAISRNEFNVLLALIGLSQEKEEVSLDSVDERRRSEQDPLLILRVMLMEESLDRTSGA